jgi:hypothetical protein
LILKGNNRISTVHCRYAALKTAEDKGWLDTQKTSEED